MFEKLSGQAPDKIMAMMGKFRADERAGKIDLGVGVYKNPEGITPVMRAVKAAEKQLWEVETTKAYTGLTGDPAYSDAMIRLILAGAVPREHIAAAATPGGSGAVRQCFELVKLANPKARIFITDPSWPSHVSMCKHTGLEPVLYRYFDEETRGVDFAGMMEDLGQMQAGDVLLLHGCCHNPTGANLTMPEWDAVIEMMNAKGVIPMIDLAYMGFGDGLEEDAAATRKVASSVPECLIAASCSKNFGIYRERTGLIMAISRDPDAMVVNQQNLSFLNRQAYSFPPDHGARLVTMILNDEALMADWKAELEEVRLDLLGLREQLAGELQRLSGSDRFGFLAQHRGMFSLLGTSKEMVDKLQAEHAVYMVEDSRMNIAGLNRETVPILAKAIIDVGI